MEPANSSSATPPPPPPLPSPPTPSPPPMQKEESQKRKPPTPQELVAMYEAEGLDHKEASLKVIRDLQTILYRVTGTGRNKKDKFMVETARKLDTVNTRLAILEMKVDSKPGFAETLAIGVAAGGLLRGIGNAAPHVMTAFSQMWSSVKNSTRT
ncbi:uncharacterized protein LOC116264538 [Nymphaea colorata]|uniref:Uncharacterized protein n=1 Tax=Nymphaea colorata TaxID=210225 RepID=A0A5K0XFF2_9MAGN|nr:uncharacterized protein LOC116264538 [Nymphaea colorata]